jgi:hypothetical protein
MTIEDKDLLLKDLYGRLLYGVKGIVEDGIKVTTPSEWPVEKSIEFSIRYMVIKNGWRPYLLPFSSMGPAEYVEFVDLGDETSNDCFGSFNFDQLDWLNAHHYDYRRLIEKGLAIDATGLNIY